MTCRKTYKPDPANASRSDARYCSRECWHDRRRILSMLPPWDVPHTIAGYMAGFLDGDGSIGINRAKSGRIEVRLANTNHGALDWMQNAVPYRSYITEHYQARKISHKTQYELCWHGPQAHGLLTAIAPHLVIKRERAEQAIAFHTAFLTRKERHGVIVPQPQPCSSNPCALPRPVSDEAFWGYMSGFIDAEGCIRINDRLKRLEVLIGNTHRCVLMYLQKHCSIHCTYSTRHDEGRSPLTTLRFARDHAATLIGKLQSLLYIKTPQALLGQQFHDTWPHDPICQHMMDTMHTLNATGQ